MNNVDDFADREARDQLQRDHEWRMRERQAGEALEWERESSPLVSAVTPVTPMSHLAPLFEQILKPYAPRSR